jgi:acetyl esterase/lipase
MNRTPTWCSATIATALLAGCAQLAQEPEGPMVEDESVLSRAAGAPDETVAYGDAPGQIADIRVGRGTPERRPLVVLVHGGFWRPAYDRAHTGPMSDALAAAGWTVATIEYRRIPGQPDLTLEDVGRAVDDLPALTKPHNGKAILIGHSAGGHLVLWAGATRTRAPLAGIVALAPVADLRLGQERNLGNGAVRAFLGEDAQARADADPIRLPAPIAPVTIVHGELDDTVPIEVGRAYARVHRDTRLVALRNAGHYGVIDPLSDAWPSVVAELQRLERPAE